MRVLLVHNAYQQQGGEEEAVKQEIQLLQTGGNEVSVYSRSNSEIVNRGPLDSLLAAKDVLWASRSRRELAEMIDSAKPKVAHFHNTFLRISPSGYYACREAGVAVVQTLHNFRLLCPEANFFRDGRVCEDCLALTPPWPGVYHGCYRKSHVQSAVVSSMLTLHRWLGTWQEQVDIYVGLTEFSRRKFIEGGLPPDKIVVKPNFVYPDPGAGVREGRYALYVGRLSSEKGVRTLLQAWRTLKSIPLKIVGDGPLMDQMQYERQLYQLESIEMLGKCTREEVLSLMRNSSILIVPSECYENFPMTIVEGFACGLPVVCSAHGALSELVESGRTGLHFVPGNPEDLASKVDWAWRHEVAMREMAKEARRDFEENYTAQRNYDMLMAIYEKAARSLKGVRS